MDRAIGPDISFYQDDNSTPQGVDFEVMKSAPSDLVIIRVGQNTWPDPDFATNWAAAKAAGIPRGSYWFYDSRSTPQSQAQRWADALGDDAGELPLFADYEENYGGAYGRASHFKTFLNEMERLLPEKEIMIYTGFYFWEDRVKPEHRYLFEDYGLWIARYNESEPWVPEPWEYEGWDFWQYTRIGDGAAYGVESKGIDLNYYNGTVEEFKVRFGLDDEVEPPIGDDMIYEGLLEVAKQIGRVASAIKNLDIVIRDDPGDDPDDDPDTGYPKKWQLVNPQKNGNVPFFRNPDTNTNKILVWNTNVVYERLPPDRFYEGEADLINLLRNWAWIPKIMTYNAGGKAFMMPNDYETTLGKDTDNWYGGGFVERDRLASA